jgi:hypothetical protein
MKLFVSVIYCCKVSVARLLYFINSFIIYQCVKIV